MPPASGNTPTSTAKTDQVFVLLDVGTAKINYAYTTPHATYTELNTDLGIVKVATQSHLFFGINAPKPYRASKITETDKAISSKTSFVSSDKVATVRTNPAYNLSAPKGSIKLSGNENVITAYIAIAAASGNVNYLWNMKKTTFDLVATDLGISKATKNDLKNAIRGMNRPTLPKASKRISGVNRSTFVDPAKTDDAEAKGWTVEDGTVEAATP